MQIKGLSNLLRSNIERGITADVAELQRRKELFGTNTYPRKKGRNFFVCFLYYASLLILEFVAKLVC
jgi:P-type Ca2+ transporter type 2C